MGKRNRKAKVPNSTLFAGQDSDQSENSDEPTTEGKSAYEAFVAAVKSPSGNSTAKDVKVTNSSVDQTSKAGGNGLVAINDQDGARLEGNNGNTKGKKRRASAANGTPQAKVSGEDKETSAQREVPVKRKREGLEAEGAHMHMQADDTGIKTKNIKHKKMIVDGKVMEFDESEDDENEEESDEDSNESVQEEESEESDSGDDDEEDSDEEESGEEDSGEEQSEDVEQGEHVSFIPLYDDSDEDYMKVLKETGKHTIKKVKLEASEEMCIIVNGEPKRPFHPVDFAELPFASDINSVTNAYKAWNWVIGPCDVNTFFENIFQKKAMVVSRKCPNYYGEFYNSEKFLKIVKSNHIEYGTNVNAAVYTDGERFTPNGVGKVYPSDISAHLQAGHSIQFVNPQAYLDSVWHVCEILQELFGCFVGANAYLTPAGTAGFAPHWDEIDAFLLQVEGRKHWKVFAPFDENATLPRDSSGNFSDEDMIDHTPIFDGWIERGDLLYIPRGFIHQGYTDADVHSLHLTVSVCRNTAFVDMLEKVMPMAVTSLGECRVSLRKSLPVRYLDMAGVLQVDYNREHLAQKMIYSVMDEHLKALAAHASSMCDATVDVMAREFFRTALPPLLTDDERELSAVGAAGDSFETAEELNFLKKTPIKLIRLHGQRLIFETAERCFMVHRMANSRIYEGRPEVLFDVDAKLVSGFERLVDAYPKWCTVADLMLPTMRQNKKLANLLFRNGLIMAKF